MLEIVIIFILIALIALFLFVGAPVKPMKWIGQTSVKLVIGALFLFFLNIFGAHVGLHLPINLFTVAVSGLLGVFGMTSLVAIHLFVI